MSPVSTSRTFHCSKIQTLLSCCTSATVVELGPSRLRLERVCYLSSENVHLQVKSYAVRKAGGLSHTLRFVVHLQKRHLWGLSHWQFSAVHKKIWLECNPGYWAPTSHAWHGLCTENYLRSNLLSLGGGEPLDRPAVENNDDAKNKMLKLNVALCLGRNMFNN